MSLLIKKMLQSIKNMQAETITNENGTAIKFPDGTMIQYGQATNTAQGYGEVNFPVNFLDTNISMIATGAYKKSGAGSTTVFDMFITADISTVSKGYLYTRRLVDGVVTRVSDIEQKIYWQAIGRWK